MPRWYALLLAAAAMPAAGQTTDRASFHLVNHTVVGTTDTVISERRSRTATELTGEFLDRVRGGRMEYRATLGPDALITALEMRYHGTPSDTGQVATFAVDGNFIVAKLGAAAPARLPGAAGILLVINPSVAFIEQMVMRARVMGGDRAQFPVFIVGSAQPLPLTVTAVGKDSVLVEYASVSMRLAATSSGALTGGTIPAQRVAIVRGPALDELRAATRDYTAPPNAPYIAEDVTVTTPAGLKLTGTLTLPKSMRGRVPAVVTITGSGPEDRDEESTALKGYRPFRELADTLGRRGIAVLRLDDRGVNGSDAGPRTATSRDFADDIRAAVAYLRGRPEIDDAKIALVGHSEGGVIAPMVASTDPRIRGIVLMAGTASTGREILRGQQIYAADSMAHLTGAARDAALAQSQRATDSLAASNAWFKFFVEYDPSILARQVKTPVLILQGLTDRQVPPSEAEKLAAAFRAGGNGSVTVRTFPETNHLFVADPSGSFNYSTLPSLRVRPEVLGAIADWLAERFR